ncbi:MAG: DUF167 domain-containing protein [Deltaproteobacteria bacterium]|jgi:uncharacterized protein YggU (UPF0235/DUF167 family)|nr:DUF167 domain-containing protein [Deltaproteobacteria bacterium]MCL5880205.1 DUF167 domain-containing protein [Deltaproteobacteria bacterium]MDA8304298.1 DUF167 domain-containing protein [Deltaproteobacteria bacterium]
MQKIISVIVKPGSKKEGYETLNDGTLRLAIKERPVENMANEAVIEKVAKIYGKPKSKITIKYGLKSKNKVIVIDE